MDRPADMMVTLRCPPSINRLWQPAWRQGALCIERTKEYARWIKEAADTAAYCRHGDKMTGPYVLRITVPENKGDLGNYEKAISDALQAGTVIGNDRDAQRIEIVRDRARQRATVLVELWAA